MRGPGATQERSTQAWSLLAWLLLLLLHCLDTCFAIRETFRCLAFSLKSLSGEAQHLLCCPNVHNGRFRTLIRWLPSALPTSVPTCSHTKGRKFRKSALFKGCPCGTHVCSVCEVLGHPDGGDPWWGVPRRLGKAARVRTHMLGQAHPQRGQRQDMAGLGGREWVWCTPERSGAESASGFQRSLAT